MFSPVWLGIGILICDLTLISSCQCISYAPFGHFVAASRIAIDKSDTVCALTTTLIKKRAEKQNPMTQMMHCVWFLVLSALQDRGFRKEIVCDKCQNVNCPLWYYTNRSSICAGGYSKTGDVINHWYRNR